MVRHIRLHVYTHFCYVHKYMYFSMWMCFKVLYSTSLVPTSSLHALLEVYMVNVEDETDQMWNVEMILCSPLESEVVQSLLLVCCF